MPGVLGIIKSTKEKTYQTQLNIIKDAASNYVMGERSHIVWRSDGRDDITVIGISSLRKHGYLDGKVMDPRTKEEVNHLAVRVVKPEYGSLKYEVVFLDDSDATYPIYGRNMIPIVYKDNRWVKADPTNENQAWFDYSKQQWANIATVTEDVRQNLLDAPIGTEIPMNKINTMFVWIPRYRYKLWNVDGSIGPENNPNLADTYTIDVVFEDVSMERTIGNQNGQWLSHPAFTFDEQELSGIWVGKFESSSLEGNGNSIELDNVASKTPIIVGNVEPWTWINLGNSYRVSRKMNREGNIYGFDQKASDVHLMKNMEWGAMAYLAYSTYGKAGNPKYSGSSKEIVGNVGTTTGGGDYIRNIAQSTTGNVSGVYDTAGGFLEHIAAITYEVSVSSLTDLSNNSGFTEEEATSIKAGIPYFDYYHESTDYFDASYSYLGDAMKEIGPFVSHSYDNGKNAWYDDFGRFFSSNYYALDRGGFNYYAISGHGAETMGLFFYRSFRGTSFAGYGSSVHNDYSFRVSIT